jgi:hypothetical protein
MLKAFFKIEIPKETKPLSEREKRWIVQREIFADIEKEDLRITNRPRYITFLKRYKLRHNPESIKLWKKNKDKDCKKINQMNKKSFGFFTSHLKLDDLFFIKSVINDKLVRGESPTMYVLSLSKNI